GRRARSSGEASRHSSHMNRFPSLSLRLRPRGGAARIASCAALLALFSSAATLADESLRARVEALADEPRIDGVAVADPWFLIRFYARRQCSPAWESDAKRDALLRALEARVLPGLNPGDY